jgi:uncharacterized CHY-type Zn-finger protein
MEDINVETIYEGSKLCRKCGHLMTPLEALYTDGKSCPNCRNAEYERHAKAGMSE